MQLQTRQIVAYIPETGRAGAEPTMGRGGSPLRVPARGLDFGVSVHAFCYQKREKGGQPSDLIRPRTDKDRKVPGARKHGRPVPAAGHCAASAHVPSGARATNPAAIAPIHNPRHRAETNRPYAPRHRRPRCPKWPGNPKQSALCPPTVKSSASAANRNRRNASVARRRGHRTSGRGSHRVSTGRRR